MANNYQEQDNLYFEDNDKHKQNIQLPPQDVSGSFDSALLLCANCKKQGYSEIKCEPNKWTFLYSVLLAPCCICFIPILVNSCQDVYHKCPHCKIQIGFTEYSPC